MTDSSHAIATLEEALRQAKAAQKAEWVGQDYNVAIYAQRAAEQAIQAAGELTEVGNKHFERAAVRQKGLTYEGAP